MSRNTDIQELSNFLLDFATTLMAVGSHTSRVVRNVTRIADSFGYGVDMTVFPAEYYHDDQAPGRLFDPPYVCEADSGSRPEFPDDFRSQFPELGCL